MYLYFRMLLYFDETLLLDAIMFRLGYAVANIHVVEFLFNKSVSEETLKGKYSKFRLDCAG